MTKTILPLRKHLRSWFSTLLFSLKLGNFPPFWGNNISNNFQDYLGKNTGGCIMKHPVFITTISDVIRNPVSLNVHYSETVNNCFQKCEARGDSAVKVYRGVFLNHHLSPPSPPWAKWAIFAFLICFSLTWVYFYGLLFVFRRWVCKFLGEKTEVILVLKFDHMLPFQEKNTSSLKHSSELPL